MASRNRANSYGSGGGSNLLNFLMGIYGGNVDLVNDTSASEKALSKAGMAGPPEAKPVFKPRNFLASGTAAGLTNSLRMDELGAARELTNAKDLQDFAAQLGLKVLKEQQPILTAGEVERLKATTPLEAERQGLITAATENARITADQRRTKEVEPAKNELARKHAMDLAASGVLSARNIVPTDDSVKRYIAQVNQGEIDAYGLQATAAGNNVARLEAIAAQNHPYVKEAGLNTAKLGVKSSEFGLTDFDRNRKLQQAVDALEPEKIKSQIRANNLMSVGSGAVGIDRTNPGGGIVFANPKPDPLENFRRMLNPSGQSTTGAYPSAQTATNTNIVKPSITEQQQAAPVNKNSRIGADGRIELLINGQWIKI